MPCGVATGLAWTPTGGEVLFVEASTMPGTGKVQLTGQLGEVMQESVHCAVSWIRANATAVSACRCVVFLLQPLCFYCVT